MKATNISKDVSEIHKIAYENGLASLKSQESELSGIRQRSTVIISISGLAATLLGREALKNPSGKLIWLNMGTLEWGALAFLAISLLCTIQVLRPKNGWIFHFAPSLIVNQFAHGDKATDLSTTYRVLSEFAETNYETNRKMLDKLYRWFNFSLIALILQIVCWTIAIQ